MADRSVTGQELQRDRARYPSFVEAAQEINRLKALSADLLASLKECSDDLAALVEDQYQNTKGHPAMKPRYDRDMTPVIAARAIIAKATGTIKPAPRP